jgi:hypothetical protein
VLYIVGYCLLLGNQPVKEEEEAGQELVRAVPSSFTQEPYHLQVIITFSTAIHNQCMLFNIDILDLIF